ncbi:unknown [Haloarcula marismortui ATCC 43049]|uniref:Uncharacterized protein n=1 Tax=Haloarcula marismortui (strain ATCC 43049 / DSM 3752 / JCM 8966 / VKM B-1809) TaxID=272569 RepID=Q5UX39_HALMA|nr:unknown [Haloarcula marismortui ATCC 43049]
MNHHESCSGPTSLRPDCDVPLFVGDLLRVVPVSLSREDVVQRYWLETVHQPERLAFADRIEGAHDLFERFPVNVPNVEFLYRLLVLCAHTFDNCPR